MDVRTLYVSSCFCMELPPNWKEELHVELVPHTASADRVSKRVID